MPHRLETRIAELVYKNLERNPILQRNGCCSAETIHQAADGATLFCHRNKYFTRSAVRIETDVNIALVAADTELVCHGVASVWQSFTSRLVNHFLFRSRGSIFRFLAFALRRKRLALLRTIAVDRNRLETKFPAPEIGFGNISHRAIGWHVHRLADRTR